MNGVDGFALIRDSIPAPLSIGSFLLFFVGMWCGISLLLSAMGGWRRLAGGFRAGDEPCGKLFFMQSGKVGLVNYSSCLTIHSASNGFYLSVWLPFRLGHPPLFIPWSAIRNFRPRRFLWFERVEFDVGSPNVATLQLSKKIFEGHNVAI
jgi:hypothetical protein